MWRFKVYIYMNLVFEFFLCNRINFWTNKVFVILYNWLVYFISPSLSFSLSYIHTTQTYNDFWVTKKWETDNHSILLFIWFQSQIGRHIGSSTMYGQSMLTNMVSVHVLHSVIPWVISAMLMLWCVNVLPIFSLSFTQKPCFYLCIEVTC